MRREQWWLGACLACCALAPAHAAESRPITPLWRADAWAGLPAVEQALFDYTNDERRKRKLPALQPLGPLTTAARQHSQEMLDENYFSHTSPHTAWATASLRAWHAGLWEGQAAENIAMMVTEGFDIDHDLLAHELMYGEHGWMNSPGHKANILHEKYTHLGLGVAIVKGRYYATQVFATPSYDLSDLQLSRDAQQFRITGRVKPLIRTSKLWPACDKTLQPSFAVQRGRTYPFLITAPRDGERHKLGLHPAIDERSFWLKYLFYVDTSQALEDALLLPYD